MEIKLKTRLGIIIASLVTTLSTVVAHSEQDQGYYGPGMMWSDGGWMHNGAHIMGYNMWGMGWYGVIFGLAFWALAILGLIYLYQKITEE